MNSKLLLHTIQSSSFRESSASSCSNLCRRDVSREDSTQQLSDVRGDKDTLTRGCRPVPACLLVAIKSDVPCRPRTMAPSRSAIMVLGRSLWIGRRCRWTTSASSMSAVTRFSSRRRLERRDKCWGSNSGYDEGRKKRSLVAYAFAVYFYSNKRTCERNGENASSLRATMQGWMCRQRLLHYRA